jgi:hypothetical protein
VDAKDKKIAEEEFFNNLPIADSFEEEFYIRCINDYFSEIFWEGLYKRVPNGEPPTDEMMKNYEPEFINNVYSFFENEKTYADLYLEFWFSDSEYPDCKLFPQEMIKFSWRKHIKSPNYTKLMIIDVVDIPYFKDENDRTDSSVSTKC